MPYWFSGPVKPLTKRERKAFDKILGEVMANLKSRR